METKSFVKVISLYDLIADNLIILLATFHHIIILAFNYYYIYTLEDFVDENSDTHYPIIEVFLTNLEFCQTATIFTFAMLFLVIAANDDQVQLNQNRVFIMFVSYIVKVLYGISNINTICSREKIQELKETTQINVVYVFILTFSYVVRFLAFGAIIGVCIAKCIDEVSSIIIDFAKNYKFTIVQHKKVQENDARNS
jgi:hypothetical protein